MASLNSTKLFIGGLSWDTDDLKLRRYFENYGTVLEAFVSYDRYTMKPRGFGFVVFEDPAVADKVVKLQHTIDRREVEAKKAVPKDDNPLARAPVGIPATRTKKVFVGGLAASVDEAAFRSYFEQFGTVEDAVVMYDHDNRRPRGFGFVTFTCEDSVERCLANGPLQVLRDKQIEIKRAVPKDLMAQQQLSTQQGITTQGSATPQMLQQIPRPLSMGAPTGAQQPIVPAVATLLNQVPSYSALQSAPPNSLVAALGQTSIGSVGGGAGNSTSYTSIRSQQGGAMGPTGGPAGLRPPQQLIAQQVMALQQQQQGMHSSQIAGNVQQLLTNTMTGIASVAQPTYMQNIMGHSTPARFPVPLQVPQGAPQGTPMGPQSINTASMNALGINLQNMGVQPQLNSISGEQLNPLHVAWEYGRAGLQLPGTQTQTIGQLSQGSGGLSTGALQQGALPQGPSQQQQQQQLPTTLETAIQSLTAQQGDSNLWANTQAAVYQQVDASTLAVLQATGSSSNSSYLESVPYQM